jgi:DNA gyrase/topoisomerase IV subunit B
MPQMRTLDGCTLDCVDHFFLQFFPELIKKGTPIHISCKRRFRVRNKKETTYTPQEERSDAMAELVSKNPEIKFDSRTRRTSPDEFAHFL